MHLTFSELFTGANLLLGLALYRKLSIMTYQHKLMWVDFADKKGISPKVNGASSGSL